MTKIQCKTEKNYYAFNGDLLHPIHGSFMSKYASKFRNRLFFNHEAYLKKKERLHSNSISYPYEFQLHNQIQIDIHLSGR